MEKRTKGIKGNKPRRDQNEDGEGGERKGADKWFSNISGVYSQKKKKTLALANIN